MAAPLRRTLFKAISSRIPRCAASSSICWQAPTLGFASRSNDDPLDLPEHTLDTKPDVSMSSSASLGDNPWAWRKHWRAEGSRFQETGLQVAETRRLLRQVNIETLKKQLHADGYTKCIPIEDMVNICRRSGIAATEEAAEQFVQTLDEAGVVLIFRGKVFIHPEEIAEKLASVVPTTLLLEKDAHKEFQIMHKELEEINAKASRQVRNYLWMGLLSLTSGTLLFFRLTFWEFSWDVMEPIAFFVTTGGILGGYAYFLVTHRDPTYLGLMHSLLANSRRKLMKRKKFDSDRYRQLEELYHGKPGEE